MNFAPHGPALDSHCGCHTGELLGALAPEVGAGFAASGPADRPGPAGELVVRGRVCTMNPAQPSAEAIAVADGRITAIGSYDEIRGYTGADATLLDVGDRVVYPGFIEPHMHYWSSALTFDWIDCATRGGVGFEEIAARLRQAEPVVGEWVLGQLFDPSLVEGERPLSRDVLDEIQPDRPCAVIDASQHFVYCNSRALELAGITEDTLDPEGGFLGRDENGRLNGALGEIPAMIRIIGALPTTSPERLVENLLRVNAYAASRGYTRTHDAATGVLRGPEEVEIFRRLAPRFDVRVSFAVHDYAMDAVLAAGTAAFEGDDMCRATSWKFVSDGSNQGRSGYQREPYLGRNARGEVNYDRATLAGRLRRAHELGWQVMVHANGDAAIDLALDAFEEALGGTSGLGRRHRIEHCSFAHPEQLDRMARLGISPSFLINHVYFWGQAFEDRIVGPEKARLLDPVGGARRRGMRVSVHSDYTVTDLDPLREIQVQVTRERFGGTPLNPDEAVGVEDAVRAKTVDAAWQTHCDDVAGSIEVGKYADLVVLDADPCEVDPERIAEIEVLRTIVGGRTVYDASSI
ncbi:amidohydrolase [Rhodococcus gannanensis]|uniref:Amidohydrolase n=1 Tax=Rhodococcus gannanensis TaxID=1960308 RepID=A0ABW4PCH1_9NOCA